VVSGTTRIVVPPGHDGERLDIFLAGSTSLSRRAVRRLVGSGGVWRNGDSVRVQSKSLETGDVVDLLLPCDELGVPATPDLPMPEILFEDRWLVVVHKPAGVLSQPAETDTRELALNQLLLLGLALREGRRPFVRLVHRIDRLTSGAVLFARNPQSLRPLTRAWAEGEVDRRYLAVVEGDPAADEFLVDQPIARDRSHRWRFRIAEDGSPAHTRVAVIERHPSGTALVECRLITGRTHQVRVHLAHLGHPVVGDRLYGARPTPEIHRPLLHAARLTLPHPQTGEILTVESPVPEDMARLLAGRQSG